MVACRCGQSAVGDGRCISHSVVAAPAASRRPHISRPRAIAFVSFGQQRSCSNIGVYEQQRGCSARRAKTLSIAGCDLCGFGSGQCPHCSGWSSTKNLPDGPAHRWQLAVRCSFSPCCHPQKPRSGTRPDPPRLTARLRSITRRAAQRPCCFASFQTPGHPLFHTRRSRHQQALFTPPFFFQ